jgi:hypothetical protein
MFHIVGYTLSTRVYFNCLLLGGRGYFMAMSEKAVPVTGRGDL